jgi:long-chain acyl-CoA synthetase
MATFYDHFRECAERWPTSVALEIQRGDRVESYTYAEVKRMAESVGRWLIDNRVEPGARIAILADNHPRWVIAYLGIIAAGSTTVPLDTALHADQIAKLLEDSGSSLVFCDHKHWSLVEGAIHGLAVRAVLTDPASAGSAVAAPAAAGDFESIFALGPGTFSPQPSSADSLASLLYTSGTTADPKGVMLTHANLLGEVAVVFAWFHLGPEDAVLGVLPLFHVLSQMANLLLPLVKGSRVVYLETLNTTELIRALRERDITAFAVVPQFFYLIHQRIFKEAAKRGRLALWVLARLMRVNRTLRRFGINAGPVFFGAVHQIFGTKMRYLVTGGSRFDSQVGRDFEALGIDVLQAYGLTETTGGAFATRHDNNVIGSVGPPLPGVEGKILDPQPQDDGPPIGEIAIRGPIVMKGYWNRPDATAAVLHDGWLYTGDLGRFDARGNLFITGRKKEVIVLSNGKNIYPEEIESQYLKSPYIKDICVLGLEGPPSDRSSDRLHAVVVPNFDVLKERKIVNAKEVLRFDIESLSAQAPSTKRVGSYEIWQEDLPRTTTRKLKRFEIEKRVRANQAKGRLPETDISAEKPLSADDVAWLDQPEVGRALGVLRERSRARSEAIRPDDNLELDLGLDSMQRIELLVALEEELGGDVEESRLAEIYTVRALVDAVLEGAVRGRPGSRPQFAGWNSILREAPTDPEVLALAETRTVGEAFWFTFCCLIQLFARDRFQLRVEGLEKLPGRGPFVISSNHQSYLDPIILASVLPWPLFHNTMAVGTSEIFGSGFMRRLAGWLRVVVVDPDRNLIPAMRAGAFGLRHGRILILYPEGERSIDGTPKIFKKGAAILSIQQQVPIVPLAIEGFYAAWPRGKSFARFAPLRMVFGDPIYPPAETEASEATYAQLTETLKTSVVGMWEELRRKTRAGEGSPAA